MRLTQPLQITILLALALVGCSTHVPNPSSCMKTTLVSNLSRSPLYPIIEDDSRSAAITINKTSCGVTKVDETTEKAHIQIELTLAIPDARKKDSRTTKATFSVFVALLDSEDNVIDRQDQNLEVIITEKSTTQTHSIIYNPPQDISLDSQEHQLLIGFNEHSVSKHFILVPETIEKSIHRHSQKPRHKKRKTVKG